MKVAVKFLKAVYPYRKGDFGQMEEALATGLFKDSVEIVGTSPETAGNRPNSSVSTADDKNIAEVAENAPKNAENKSMSGRKSKKTK